MKLIESGDVRVNDVDNLVKRQKQIKFNCSESLQIFNGKHALCETFYNICIFYRR